jgi:hypothetical protein
VRSPALHLAGRREVRTITKRKPKLQGKLAREFGLMEYVAKLRQYDHAFLTVEGAMRFSKPFGFNARTYVERANPNDPKGLTLHNGAASAEGIAAHHLAEQICQHVGVDYPECFGRGSQLHACCDALENWLKG